MPTPPSILVRRLTPADAPSLYAAVQASLPELCAWMPWCHADYTLADSVAWIEFTQKAWDAGREFPLGVFDAASGQVIGGTGVNQINKPNRMGNVGYWVSTPHTGRGVARAAARQAAELGFDTLALTRLEILALHHNAASQRVAESLGALRECRARNRLVLHGQVHDAIVYSLVPKDLGR